MPRTLRQRKRVTATAAEHIVARLDSYSQEEHAELINAARERAASRRAARTERARAAAARLRNAS